MALPTRGMLNPALVLVEQLNAERLALGRTAVATQSMDLLMTSTSGININISGARQVISHGDPDVSGSTLLYLSSFLAPLMASACAAASALHKRAWLRRSLSVQ